MKKTKYIFLAAGVVILAVLFKTFGATSTVDHMKSLGWYFAPVVLIHIISNGGMALAWGLFLPCPKGLGNSLRLFAARVAGDATASINALGAVAGEPIKALYVRDIVPLKTGLASVVLDRTIHSISAILIFLTGIITALFVLDLPVLFSVISLAAMAGAMALMALILHQQKKGFLAFFVSKLPRRLRDKLLTDSRREKIKMLDEELGLLLKGKNRRRFIVSLLIHYFITLTVSTFEIYLIVKFSGAAGNFNILHAMFVYIFGFILTSAMFFMPANLGSSEGSYSLALSMLGYDPALGLSLGIIRRLRTFVWSGVGILLLFYAGLINKAKETQAS